MAITFCVAGGSLALAAIGHFAHIGALRDLGALLFLMAGAIC